MGNFMDLFYETKNSNAVAWSYSDVSIDQIDCRFFSLNITINNFKLFICKGGTKTTRKNTNLEKI